MNKACKSCKYIRPVINEFPDYHFDFLCRFTNKPVNVFEDGEDCTTYEHWESRNADT